MNARRLLPSLLMLLTLADALPAATPARPQPTLPMDIPVLVLRYFPVKGDRIDRAATGDWDAPLDHSAFIAALSDVHRLWKMPQHKDRRLRLAGRRFAWYVPARECLPAMAPVRARAPGRWPSAEQRIYLTERKDP